MSASKKQDTHVSNPEFYFSAGVFKFESIGVGFPDLKKIVEEWKKDTNFVHLMVRKVSKSNYGIQFLYIDSNSDGTNVMSNYRNELKDRFEEYLYAWDFQESRGDNPKDAHFDKMIIVQKEIKL